MTTQPPGDLRRVFLRDGAAGRHQADVGVGEIIGVEVRHLQRLVAVGDLGCRPSARRRAPPLRRRKAALGKNVQHLRPTLPVAPATAILKPMSKLSFCLSSSGEGETARCDREVPVPGLTGGESGGQRRQTVFVVVLAVVLRASEKWLIRPAYGPANSAQRWTNPSVPWRFLVRRCSYRLFGKSQAAEPP